VECGHVGVGRFYMVSSIFFKLGSVPVHCYGTTKTLYIENTRITSLDNNTIKLNSNIKVTFNPKGKVP
jgi:hypothetical protein